MKLYLVHCGYYDLAVGNGLYESHTNFFVVAENFDDAKLKAKSLPEFKDKRMHIDGMQELDAVNGYRLNLAEDRELNGESVVALKTYKELLPTSGPVSIAPN